MAWTFDEKEDGKWITIHPNGKEEKPGVKVAINAAGKVEKGPKGLKEDINAKGGLPGAKSVPLEELKAQQQDKTEEPDFTAPGDDDFAALFEDEPKREEKEFPEEIVENFLIQYDDVAKPIAKKMLEEHPEWFEVDTVGGNVAYPSIEAYKKSVSYMKEETEKAKANVKASAPTEAEVNEMAPDFTPPSDDEFAGLLDDEENVEDPSTILAKNLMGEEEKEETITPVGSDTTVNVSDIKSLAHAIKESPIGQEHPGTSEGDLENRLTNYLTVDVPFSHYGIDTAIKAVGIDNPVVQALIAKYNLEHDEPYEIPDELKAKINSSSPFPTTAVEKYVRI